MWSHTITELTPGQEWHVRLNCGGQAAKCAEVISAWGADSEFRTFFTALLSKTPSQAFRWETPPITTATLSLPWECVLLNAPDLDRPADEDSFAEHFKDVLAEVVVFSNLRGDATLIVPCPRSTPQVYPHLATFLRQAPPSQHQALWQAVGQNLSERIGPIPIWLSTAGAGVAWLHVRLDSRPKYYRHIAYRKYAH